MKKSSPEKEDKYNLWQAIMFQHIATTQVVINVNFSSVDDGKVNEEIRHTAMHRSMICVFSRK